jgi:uncharacterized protein (TIGR00369 family)
MAHGGVALVLLDTVGGVHLLATRPELARLVTISLSANFIGPVRPGLVLATAEIQRIGGSVAYTSMALHAGEFDGELLATAHGAYRLFHATGWTNRPSASTMPKARDGREGSRLAARRSQPNTRISPRMLSSTITLPTRIIKGWSGIL